MQYPVTATLLGVSSAPTSTGKQRFVLELSDGNKYSTLDENLATRAYALAGQPVVLQAERTDRGFLNAKEVAAAGGAVVPVIPSVPSAGGGSVSKPLVAADDRDHRIMRGNALNASCALLAGVPLAQSAQGAEVALQVARVFYDFLREQS
jgi:hypothetical protein